ncbi:hypothetical protein QJS04_geneDACA023029 [Acorus gramineus]|uniref:Uncharacterized protein n=1 Tax=Acorus gramineus TaxID=55184 RepID=A0AAV9AA86_ACOGR|nr:hypothetical protein QJS04_geneDACA023029 [Acorus gramineus]
MERCDLRPPLGTDSLVFAKMQNICSDQSCLFVFVPLPLLFRSSKKLHIKQ